MVPVAMVAGGRLPGFALDVVGGCALPGGNLVEPGESIFFVMVEEFGIHGNVSHEHEVKIRLRGVGIVRQTDFEVFDIIPVGVVGKTVRVRAGMATVAIGVGLGVADLTLHLADMDIVVAYLAVF